MRSLILASLTLVFCSQVTTAAKILFFFGAGTYSHKIGIWPLVSALADRGHNITIISPFLKQPSPNPKVRDVAPQFLVDLMSNVMEADRLEDRQNQVDNEIWFQIPTFGVHMCEVLVNNSFTDPTLRNVLFESKYDLMVINSILSECGVIWAKYHGTSFMYSMSTSAYPWIPDVFGFPAEASWLPDLTLQRMSYPMTFFDRLRNFYRTLYIYYQRDSLIYPKVAALAQRVLNTTETPDILAIERNASIVLMNTYYGTEFGRALPPFVIPVGGMQCWHPTKPLKQEIEKIMEDSEDGAIMISFGSSVEISNVSSSYVDRFMEAIRQFPKISFLWKWDGAVPSNAPKNLYFIKWLPQMEILKHPKLLTFITHCGLNSKMEATCNGVPVIAMPLFAEQDYNAYHVDIYKLGVTIEARDLTSATIVQAIKEVTTNTIYRTNMRKAQQIFRDRYLDPIETSIYWTEYVLRNDDTSFLKPLNYHQTWWQRRHGDIISFIMAVVVTIILVALVLVLIVISFLRQLVAKYLQPLLGLFDGSDKPKQL